mmetsp:Transcript_13720/g.26054  ORF Transcript_13720/g.26054 Transcript_13720/m.26054 type:complete len:130 (+) Transcript_13720:74-463(+)
MTTNLNRSFASSGSSGSLGASRSGGSLSRSGSLATSGLRQLGSYSLEKKPEIIYGKAPTFLGRQFHPNVDYTGVEIYTTGGMWYKHSKKAPWELHKSNSMPGIGTRHEMRAMCNQSIYITRQPHEVFRK